MSKDELQSGNWLADLVLSFKPDSIEVTGTPAEMTHAAAWKAFSVSAAASVVPGPLGWATIVPELLAVTKIQINLIYAIAKSHGQEGVVDAGLVLLLLGSNAGIAGKYGLGHILTRTGTKAFVPRLSAKVLQPLAQKLGANIAGKVTARSIGRWVPFVLAPVFGAFSKSMTTQIGERAELLFSREVVRIEDNADPVPADPPETGTPS